MNNVNSENMNGAPTVWLSYVAYPVTTAAYIERALRKICRSVTVGPPLPEELIDLWQLQQMNAPSIQHDIVTDFSPDMAEVLHRSGMPRPDLYLWVESVPGHLPRNINSLGCPTACYLIDSHLHLDRHLELARGFDYVFIAQRAYLEKFRAINPKTFWLPLGCDPEVHRSWPLDKIYDVGFVGGIPAGSRREEFLNQLNEVIPVHFERCFWDDMARLFSSSRMVFNNAVKNDLNMRFFEVMSTGTLLLSDMASGSGQDELFVDGEDYACYLPATLTDTARFYLKNVDMRECIARRGRQLVVNAHTYAHRVEDLLAVTLNGKHDTFDASELRQRSITGLNTPFEEILISIQTVSPSRSFVIPVLDYSPASEYNILTLLADLEQIDGEVIVVFNGASVGEELQCHPRITRHAIMKQNVGVARGWNVGIDMAEGESIFIVNSDAHISNDAVLAIEQGLRTLPNAVCAGPQGSFFNFSLGSDYCYFDRGSFDRPLEVDAVSGFFFALNRRLFAEHGLQFDNAYTPCYFEEWDLGLQVRRAGLKNYIVPTESYDHHWSGTIRALRTIPHMGREETAGDILKRNRQYFMAKWRDIAHKEQIPHLLESGWKRHTLTIVRELMSGGRQPQALETLQPILASYPYDFEVMALHKLLSML